jgi:hypothetical protein
MKRGNSGEIYANEQTMCLSELIGETLTALRRRRVPGHRYTWTTERIAEAVGFAEHPNKAAARVYRWAEHPESVVRILRFISLAAANGEPTILQRLADEADFCLYKFPKPGGMTMSGALAAAGAACEKAGRVAGEFSEAFDPGGDGGEAVTAREIEKIDAATFEAIAALLMVRELAHQEAGDG